MQVKEPPLQEPYDNGSGHFRQTWALWFNNLKQFLRCIYVSKDCNVGIGVEDPTASLHLRAGTATTPPLKFEDGTLTTTAEKGAIEFDGGHLSASIEDGVRYSLTMGNSVKIDTTTVENTTTETAIFTKNFAANELHADEVVTFTLTGSATNSSASDDFTLRINLDGTPLYTVSRVGGNVTDAGWEVVSRLTVRTDGVSGTFIEFFKYGEDSLSPYMESDLTLHSIDTTTTHTITITVQWGNAKIGNVFNCSQGFMTLNH